MTGSARLNCKAPVCDPDGRHLLTPDLLDVEQGVAGEYDGVAHLAQGPGGTSTEPRSAVTSESSSSR